MNRSKVTFDHDEIRRWAESRGGKPVAVKGTSRGSRDVGMIRIDFPGYSGAGKLAAISWDEWFDRFDESNLAMILQDETARGQRSHVNKLVARESVEGGNGKAHIDKSKSRRARQRAGSHTRPSGGTRARGSSTGGARTSARRTSAKSTLRRKPGMSASRSSRTHAASSSRTTRKRGTSKRSRGTSARSRGRSSRRSNR